MSWEQIKKLWDDRFIEIVIGFSIVGLLVSIGLWGWWNYQNPCVEWHDRQAICGGGSYCRQFSTPDSHGASHCIWWDSHPTYPCTVTECTRRVTRAEYERRDPQHW